MNPFELINIWRYEGSPFSIPCPHCASIATYEKEKAKSYPSYQSEVAFELTGEVLEECPGTFFGQCTCNNAKCQERTYFIGPYCVKENDYDNEPVYREFMIKYFIPPVPLIQIPDATPSIVSELLKRSFAPAFMDQAASGHLLRSAIEKLLTALKVPRFVVSAKKRRVRLTLHTRIEKLPSVFQTYREALLAIKWIGNAATHENLSVEDLKLLYEIVEDLLENLYGTKKRELLRAIRRVNRRERP